MLKCHKWLCYAVCSNRRMYAVIRQKWECMVSCCCRSVINGFVMRFVAIGECSRFTAGMGMYGFGRSFLAVAEVPQMALLCGLLGFIKNGRCGEIPPCRKYSILQFRFIYQSVADWLCVIVSAPSDLSKAVLFIQLFCRFVITADLKKNAFYAAIFAFIYEIFH